MVGVFRLSRAVWELVCVIQNLQVSFSGFIFTALKRKLLCTVSTQFPFFFFFPAQDRYCEWAASLAC